MIKQEEVREQYAKILQRYLNEGEYLPLARNYARDFINRSVNWSRLISQKENVFLEYETHNVVVTINKTLECVVFEDGSIQYRDSVSWASRGIRHNPCTDSWDEPLKVEDFKEAIRLLHLAKELIPSWWIPVTFPMD